MDSWMLMTKVCTIVKRVDFSKFPIRLAVRNVYPVCGAIRLELAMHVLHRTTGEEIAVSASRDIWAINAYALGDTALEALVCRTVYDGFLSAITHEAAEMFLFDGRRIYDPHVPELGF